MIRGVKINSPQQKGIFKYLAQNISHTLQGSGVKTSVASILKTLVEVSDLSNDSPKDHSSEFPEYGIATSTNYGHLKIGDGLITDQEKIMSELPITIEYRSRVAVNRNDELFFVGRDQSGSYKYMILNSDNNIIDPQVCNMYLGYSNSKFIGLGDRFIGFRPYSSYLSYYQKNSLTNEWEYNQRWINFPYNIGDNFLIAQNTVDGDEIWENTHNDAILIMLKDNNNYYRFYWLAHNFSLTPAFDYSINSNILSISLNLYYTTLAIAPDYILVIDTYNHCVWKHNLITDDTWTSFSISGNYGNYLYNPSSFVQPIDENNYSLHICCSNGGYSVKHLIYNSTGGGFWNYYIEYFSSRSKELNSNYTFFYLNNKIYNLATMWEDIGSIIYSRLINLDSNVQWEPDGFNYISHNLEIDSTKIYLKEESSVDDPLENAREPISHASVLEKYGLGTTDLYGHVKLVDDYENVPLKNESITELSLKVTQRNQSAVNRNGEFFFLGVTEDPNTEYGIGTWSYQILDSKGLSSPQPIPSLVLSIFNLYNDDQELKGEIFVAGIGNGFLLFGASTTIVGCFKYPNGQWVFEPAPSEILSLPFSFCNSDGYNGQIAYLTTSQAWEEDQEDNIYLMIFNPDENVYGYEFYRISYELNNPELKIPWSIKPLFDFKNTSNILYPYDFDIDTLILVYTPMYLVVLDTNYKTMWKHRWEYDDYWYQANNSLPFLKTLKYPIANTYENYTNENNIWYLHICGIGNPNGNFFQKTFDLDDPYWSDPNETAGYIEIEPQWYYYWKWENYSACRYKNILYIFVGNNEDYTSKIYSCNLNIFEPTWQEGSISMSNSSQAAGGNGLIASSYAINTLRNNFNNKINQIMSERNFHNELDRRLTEYLITPEHND